MPRVIKRNASRPLDGGAQRGVQEVLKPGRASASVTEPAQPKASNEGAEDRLYLSPEELKNLTDVDARELATGSADTMSPQDGLIAHLLGAQKGGTSPATGDAPILPESIEERLELYAPELAQKVAQLPPERVKLYHGGDASPAGYNPVLVNDDNKYCAVDEGDLSLAMSYMTGKMSMDSLLWRSTDEPDRLTALRRAGHSHYGFMTEFSVPPEFFGTAWDFRDNLMANDFLFATRIGTYNLDKLSQAKTPEEEEAALEWFSTSDFIEKFLPGSSVDELLALKRSDTELRHDYDGFERIQTNNRIQAASRGIGEVDGFFYTHHEKMAGHNVFKPCFRYRDQTGKARTLEINQDTKMVVDGEVTPFNRKMISANERRLVWTLPGGEKIKVGKRARLPETTTNGRAQVSFGFSFDDSGELQISVTTEKAAAPSP